MRYLKFVSKDLEKMSPWSVQDTLMSLDNLFYYDLGFKAIESDLPLINPDPGKGTIRMTYEHKEGNVIKVEAHYKNNCEREHTFVGYHLWLLGKKEFSEAKPLIKRINEKITNEHGVPIVENKIFWGFRK